MGLHANAVQQGERNIVRGEWRMQGNSMHLGSALSQVSVQEIIP